MRWRCWPIKSWLVCGPRWCPNHAAHLGKPTVQLWRLGWADEDPWVVRQLGRTDTRPLPVHVDASATAEGRLSRTGGVQTPTQSRSALRSGSKWQRDPQVRDT